MNPFELDGDGPMSEPCKKPFVRTIPPSLSDLMASCRFSAADCASVSAVVPGRSTLAPVYRCSHPGTMKRSTDSSPLGPVCLILRNTPCENLSGYIGPEELW